MAYRLDCNEKYKWMSELNQSKKLRACFNSAGGSGKSWNTRQAIFVLGIKTAHIVIKIAKKYMYVLLFETNHSSRDPLYGEITLS